MSDFFDFYFYWLGVASALLFVFVGYAVVMGLLITYVWRRLFNGTSLAVIFESVVDLNEHSRSKTS